MKERKNKKEKRDIKKEYKEKRVGERKQMNNGMFAEIIQYYSCKNITVKFEDGNIRRRVKYGDFERGRVSNKKNGKVNLLKYIGEEQMMKCGMKVKIIAYRKTNDIDIEFEDGYIKRGCSYHSFKNGNIKNPYIPTVCGIGYLGETITVDKNGKRLLSYEKWTAMLKRCYDEKVHERCPTYINCEVCEEWKCYANFKQWFDNNYYELENERIELDKDILSEENKIYSPDTCILIPQKINGLFKEYNRATDEHIINIVESYKGKIPDEIYLKISQKLTKNTLQI